MKTFLLVIAFLICTGLVAQNTEKTNTSKHIQSSIIQNEKGSPVWEEFDLFQMPPTNWQLISGPTPETWDTASFDPFWGVGYVHCMYDETLSGNQDEYLITPVVDLRTFSNVSVSFNFQFSKYWGISPVDNYDLLVLASTDSAQTFPDTLWTELSTDTSLWNSYEWVLAQIDLSAYIGQEKFALAFVYSGYDGAEAALDMVNLETVGGMDEQQIRLSVYPNPASGLVNLSATESGVVVISNLQGQAIMQMSLEPGQQINVSDLESGHYFITVLTKSGVGYSTLQVMR